MSTRNIGITLFASVLFLLAGSAWALPPSCDIVCTPITPDSSVCAACPSSIVMTCGEWEGFIFVVEPQQESAAEGQQPVIEEQALEQMLPVIETSTQSQTFVPLSF